MPPIVEQPEAYFKQFIRHDDPLLRELESEAQAEKIPIIGPVVGSFSSSSPVRWAPIHPGAGNGHGLLGDISRPGLRSERRLVDHAGA